MVKREAELPRQFKDARALLDDLPGAPAAG